jgi:hypothetical protein
METKKLDAIGEWVDPDAAPELTEERFERADLYQGDYCSAKVGQDSHS